MKSFGKIVITIDGPAGTGKTTTARFLSQKLNLDYLNTGLMFRTIAWVIYSRKINVDNKEELLKILRNLSFKFVNGKLLIDNEEIPYNELLKPQIGKIASYIATFKEVREKLLEEQRKIIKENQRGIVVEGRDIGTVVYPEADVKIYLDADIKVRAERRYNELVKKGIKISFEEVLNELESRDKLDKERKLAPLRIPDGAIYIDTTNLTLEEQLNKVLYEVCKRLNLEC